jgi:hypothetical protein
MASFWVVPAFYPFEDRGGKLLARLPFFRVQQLQLHRAPERFHHGIVVAIANTAHGGEKAGGAQALTKDP